MIGEGLGIGSTITGRQITPDQRRNFETQERDKLALQIKEAFTQAQKEEAAGNKDALPDLYTTLASRIQTLDKLRALEISRRFKDTLTGLHNRLYFEAIKEEIEKFPSAYSNTVGFLIIDIDHFKNINDTLGHDKGDVALINIAQAIRGCIDHNDIVIRWGEEFLVILLGSLVQGFSRQEILTKVAERIRTTVEACEIPNIPKTTISVGGSEYLGASNDLVNQAIVQADQCLLKAKAAGRNQVQISSD